MLSNQPFKDASGAEHKTSDRVATRDSGQFKVPLRQPGEITLRSGSVARVFFDCTIEDLRPVYLSNWRDGQSHVFVFVTDTDTFDVHIGPDFLWIRDHALVSGVDPEPEIDPYLSMYNLSDSEP